MILVGHPCTTIKSLKRKKTKNKIEMKNIPKKQTCKQSNPTHEKKKKYIHR